MTRERPRRGPRARKYAPLGILIGTDDGLLECIPGVPPERAIDGPRITSIDASGDLAIAGAPGGGPGAAEATEGGVWLHNGLRWRQIWSGAARSVQIEGETLYVGTADGRLLLSEDEGFSWNPLYGTRELWGHGGMLGSTSAHPAVTGVAEVRGGIAVGFDGGGVWFTPNFGGTWLRRGEGTDPSIQRLYRHPDIPDRLYVTTASGMYRSTDEGHTWLQSLKDLDRGWGGSLAVLPGPTDALVLSLARSAPGREGALFRTLNAGLTWARILLDGEDEWERVPAVVGPRDLDGVAFVAAGSRLFASHDRGQTWTSLAEGLPPVNALAASV